MSPTELRDRAMRIAKDDPEAALRLARAIPDPWFRAQALAAVARWTDAERVERLAAEALASAAACPDDYKRAAVAAWPIRALLERHCARPAAAALDAARARALAAEPAASRAEALFGLLQAAWDLGPGTRRRLLEDLAETHEQDPFWRVTRCLIDAVAMVMSTEPELAAQVVERISDPRSRAKAQRRLEAREACAPREYFRG